MNFKKFFVAAVFTSFSSVASAIPASMNNLVQDLISSGKLSSLIDQVVVFQNMTITRTNKYETAQLYRDLLEKCGQAVASRSASVLKVTFDSQEFYFATSSEPQDLELCQ